MAIHAARQGGRRIWPWLALLALLYAATVAATAWTLWLALAAAYPAAWLAALGCAICWATAGALTEYLYQRRST